MRFINNNCFYRAIAAALVALALARCSGGGGGSGGSSTTTVEPTLTSLYAAVFAPSCAQCHVPGGASNGSTIDFTSITTAYQTLLSAKVSGQSTAGACAAVNIVATAHPEASYLEAVLDPTYAHANFVESGCTPYAVHLQNTALTSGEKTALAAWIAAGAPNN